MRYIIFLFLLSVLFASCSTDTEITCETHLNAALEHDLGFDQSTSIEEAWDWFLASRKVPESVEVLGWNWEELGPTKTPEEGGISEALRDSYRGRGNGTGRVNNLVINPVFENQVFACSPTGGLFCSRDFGKTWKNGGTDKLPISGVSAVTINPLDSSNWLISTGDGDDQFIFSDGVYRTFNSGLSWERINGNLDFKLPIEKFPFSVQIGEVVSHPCDFNKQFLASNKGFYKSGNAMQSVKKVKWRRVSEDAYYDVEISPHDESIIVAGGEHLQLSMNCGKSFKRIKRPTLKDEGKYKLVRMNLEFSPSNPEKLYVAISRQKALGKGGIGSGYLFEFDLTTGEWKEIRELRKVGNLIPTRGRAFEVSPKTDDLMLIGNVKPVYRSHDRGLTFEKIQGNQMHDDIHDFEFFSDGDRVLVAHDGGVSVSEDSGETWSISDDGIGVANIHGLDVSSGENPMVIYGAYDTGTTLYKNGEWRHVGFGDGFQAVIDYADTNRMVLSMQNGGLYYSENASTFNRKAKARGFKASWHTWVKQNPLNANALYVSGSDVVRSLDFGESWELICEPAIDLELGEKPWKFFLSEFDKDQMFVVALGESRAGDYIYFSTNVNDTADVVWKKTAKVPHPNWVSSILPTSDCETCHYITLISYDKNGKLFYFNGESYKPVAHPLEKSSIKSAAIDKRTNRIYVGTTSGVYTKSHEENKWTHLGGLPSTMTKSMKINYASNELFVGTFGRGVWKSPVFPE